MRAAAHLTMGQQTGAGEGGVGGVGPWVRAASLALLTACYSLGELGHFLIATTSKQVANTVLYCTVLYCTCAGGQHPPVRGHALLPGQRDGRRGLALRRPRHPGEPLHSPVLHHTYSEDDTINAMRCNQIIFTVTALSRPSTPKTKDVRLQITNKVKIFLGVWISHPS